MTIFDIFIGFLPELSSSTRDINKTVDDTFIFTLFLGFLSMSVYFNFVPNDYSYMGYLISVFLLISFEYYQIKTRLYNSMKVEIEPTHIETDSIKIDMPLQVYKERINIKYRDLWHPTTFTSLLPNHATLDISFNGKNAEAVSVSLNKRKLKNSYRFHLKDLVMGKVFEQVVRDARNDLWLIELRLWGFFKPRLIVITKLLNP